MTPIPIPNLPDGVRAYDFGPENGIWHHFLGVIGQWFDLDGKPNEVWLRGNAFTVRILGRPPDAFPALAGMLARAMRVDAERISVQQTHRFAGRFLLDGEPIGLIAPAAMHAYFTAFMGWLETQKRGTER